MDKISVAQARQKTSAGQTALLEGWVRSRRDSKGGFSFIELNDGSSLGNIQIIAPNTLENYSTDVLNLTTGSSVAIEGEIVESPGAKQPTEVHALKITVYGFADAETYPMQKKRHSFEYLRTVAHLRPRTNTFGAVFRVRNCICRAIHNFFQENGFLYIHTPLITTSDCEGAGEMFQVTTLNLDNVPKIKDGPAAGKVDYAQDFFQKKTNLTVSGQLAVENFACALGKVYTFGPTFRAENSNTSRHLSEFWMVEPEIAFARLPENMKTAENMLKRIFSDCLNFCAEDMEFFNKQIDESHTLIDTLTHVIESEFVHLPYTEAIKILEQSGRQFDYPVKWGIDMQAEHERFLTEVHFKAPVVVTDYPKEIKAFYMYLNEDEKTVRAMDVLVPGIGEIIGGSEREYRLDVLNRRMVEMNLNPADYQWYSDLRRYGTIPHSGFGLGLERAVMYATAMSNIRDVIPFPRYPGNAEF